MLSKGPGSFCCNVTALPFRVHSNETSEEAMQRSCKIIHLTVLLAIIAKVDMYVVSKNLEVSDLTSILISIFFQLYS